MASKKILVTGSDLYKGFKIGKNEFSSGQINDILPFQMLSLEVKSIDWIKAVADYYDNVSWNNIEKKASKIQRNYMMRYGKLNKSDYIINPEINPFHQAIGMFVPEDNDKSPLRQFYPVAPNFVDVMRGEFIKRDNRWTIDVVDPYSHAEMFAEKENQFKQVISQNTMMLKQQTLAEMGLTEEVDPEQFQQQMQAVQDQLTNIEFEAKNFRTTGAKWAEKVIKIHEKRYNLHEIEPDAFESGLITDSEYWHLDLMDDDFKVELLNPMYCDYFKSPNNKYVSDGDYFAWFDLASTGDIVNKYGRRMKEDDMKKLKDVYVSSANLLIPDYAKAMPGAYYDRTKSWKEATDLNPRMNDLLLGQELAYNYMRTPNFDHNIDTDIFGNNQIKNQTGHPQMFRVMRLYWRSLKKIGWLTKIDRDGTMMPPTWIDENFEMTVEPVYDKSKVETESKDNLLYGEHIDWTWVPDWRHVIKISPNGKHTFWMESKKDFDPIYIDGASVKFQFKGRDNPFDSLPPIEGCSFSWINSAPHSFIDRIAPWQILYNISMNKVPKKILEDKGPKIAIDRRMIHKPTLNADGSKTDPITEFEDKLENSSIFDYSLDAEALRGLGQPALPSILQLSTAQEAQLWLQVADQIKWMAGETIGITRQRVGGQKASETATGIQQGINYSETQTEKYFEQHSNLMQRVRQRMIDAAQFYTTFKESSKSIYMNDDYENVWIDIEGVQNLLPHYNINLESKANVRAVLSTITQYLLQNNTSGMKDSAKIDALVENSIPKIRSAVKKSELEQEQRETAQYQAQIEQQQKQAEMQAQMKEQQLVYNAEQAQFKRETDIEVATIRALGGIQTDNNKDGSLDANANLEAHFKQQELSDKRQLNSDQIASKQQSEQQRLILEREKALIGIQKEKIKQEGALKIAKENTREKG